MTVKLTPAVRPYSERGTPYEVPALATAVDEIYYLRAFAAEVAASIEEDLALATLPVSTRRRLERLLVFTEKATTGEVLWDSFDAKARLKAAGLPDAYSDEQWAESQGVGTVKRERA